jgi:integrase
MLAEDPARVLTVSGSTVRSLRPDEIPTREDVERLADAVGKRYRALVLLLAYGGLRIGEAVGLRVDRIDWKGRRITVDQAGTEVGGKLVFGQPKTRASVRTFTAPRFLVDELRAHADRYPSDSGLVFTGPNGAPVRPSNFRRRVFDPAAKAVGLDGLHLHDLRHTAASSLAAMGASATEIAARLGHSNAATTARVYLHLLAARDEKLADLQDAAWSGDREEAG